MIEAAVAYWVGADQAASSPAEATPAPVVATSADPSFEAIGVEVGTRMARQDWRGALAVLDRVPPEAADKPDVLFIRAFLLRRLGRFYPAIDIYQRLLDSDASLLRVRLELADTYFELGDDRSAEHNYRLAVGAHLPPEVGAKVETQLKALGERRRWRYTLNVAVAPDSNVNAATDAREMQIFGLPFELSDDARRTSGVSFSTQATADRSVPLHGKTRLAIGGWGRFTDNEGTVFDDGAVGLRVGPQLWVGATKLEIQGRAERRWFGGQPLSTTGGGELDLQWGWGRTQNQLNLSSQRVDYDVNSARDAWISVLSLERTRYLSATKFWRVSATAGRGDAEAASESFWLSRLSVGGYQTLPAGWAVWAEPSLERRVYDGPSVLDPEARRDLQWALAVRLIKRDWRYRGFSPYVGLDRSRNDSNIDINSFTRLRVEFGATRTF